MNSEQIFNQKYAFMVNNFQSVMILEAIIIALLIIIIIKLFTTTPLKEKFDGNASDPTLAIFNSQSKLGVQGSNGGPQQWQDRSVVYNRNVEPTEGVTQVKNSLSRGSTLALRGAVGGPQDYQ